MRFKNVVLLDIDLNNENSGDYEVLATKELIEITNKIRERQGNTDLVGVDLDNDVYYTYYLCFDTNKQEISLNVSVANSKKDDFAYYVIDLFPEEKEMFLWKVVRELLVDNY